MDERLVEIVEDLFDLPADAVRPDLSREDVELWDSLNHLRLVSAVEGAFGVKFSMADIESINGLPRLRELIGERAA